MYNSSEPKRRSKTVFTDIICDLNRNSLDKISKAKDSCILRHISGSMAPEAARYNDYVEVAGKTPDLIPDADKFDWDKETRLKCVLLGDGAVGKTSLVVSYTTNGYPTEYIPTAFDNYTVRIKVDNKPVRLQLCDTAGQDEFDYLRTLCYPNTDVFILCFSVVRPTSFHNIRDKWISEIKRHHPKTPILLVGTQSDLRNSVDVLVDLAKYSEKPVTVEEASEFAQTIGAAKYVECSALTQKNLKEVFDTAIVEALERNERTLRKSLKKKRSFLRGSKREKAQRKAKEMKRLSVTWWKKYCCFT